MNALIRAAASVDGAKLSTEFAFTDDGSSCAIPEIYQI
jgi:hypothetical protein